MTDIGRACPQAPAAALGQLRRRFLRALALAVAASGAIIGSATAQQEVAQEGSRSNCPSGTTHRECSWFWVTEAGFAVRVSDEPYYEGFDGDFYPSFELGAIRNFGSHLGIGAAAFVGFNNLEFKAGFKPRVRVWASDDLGIDIAGGVLCCLDGFDDPLTLSSHVGFSYRDQAALIVQHQRRRARRVGPSPSGELFYDHEVFLGAKIGSARGVWVGTATALVGAVVALVLLAGAS